MHFNTKYIFNGDSEEVIIDKINYNFNQISSFAVGPMGHIGSRGKIGISAPAGRRGAAGVTGQRGSNWFSQPGEPLSTLSIIDDVWIDTSLAEGPIKTLGATGWNYSGYNFSSSVFFDSYSYIGGPAGTSNKYVVGFKSTGITSPSKLSLIIGDSYLTPDIANPNNSKVLVSTNDQISRPIMSFGKTSSVSRNVPSFYWSELGTSTSLIFNSDASFDINAYLKLSINTDLAAIILNNNNININSKSLNINGNGNFILGSSAIIGTGGSFNINSLNVKFDTDNFIHNSNIVISSGTPGIYSLDIVPSNPGYLPGTSVGISSNTGTDTNKSFVFSDGTSYPVLSGNVKGSVNSGNHSQTVFGSIGGSPGGTAGPYFYHVKKTKEIRLGTNNVYSREYLSDNFSTLGNVIDISNPLLWDSNHIIITPTSYTSVVGGVYIKIPSSISTNLYPLYSDGKSIQYRIFLNSLSTDTSRRYIQGLIFSGDFPTGTTYNVVTNNSPGGSFIPSTCQYIDLIWIPRINAITSLPRLFYKTCSGFSGQISFTDEFIQPSPPIIPVYWGFISAAVAPYGGSLNINKNGITVLSTPGGSGILYFSPGDTMDVSVLTYGDPYILITSDGPDPISISTIDYSLSVIISEGALSYTVDADETDTPGGHVPIDYYP
jgi:hypothetical protein